MTTQCPRIRRGEVRRLSGETIDTRTGSQRARYQRWHHNGATNATSGTITMPIVLGWKEENESADFTD
jgi:hypothetical protein